MKERIWRWCTGKKHKQSLWKTFFLKICVWGGTLQRVNVWNLSDSAHAAEADEPQTCLPLALKCQYAGQITQLMVLTFSNTGVPTETCRFQGYKSNHQRTTARYSWNTMNHHAQEMVQRPEGRGVGEWGEMRSQRNERCSEWRRRRECNEMKWAKMINAVNGGDMSLKLRESTRSPTTSNNQTWSTSPTLKQIFPFTGVEYYSQTSGWQW